MPPQGGGIQGGGIGGSKPTLFLYYRDQNSGVLHSIEEKSGAIQNQLDFIQETRHISRQELELLISQVTVNKIKATS